MARRCLKRGPRPTRCGTKNRRQAPRRRVFKRALMHLVDVEGAVNCHVRSLSSSGAAIRIDAPFDVPKHFALEIVGTGKRRRVELRWQSGVDMGVQFADGVE